MTRWKTVASRAALAGALALGLGLGLVSQPGMADAQASAQATTTATTTLGSRFLDQLAAALGIERQALDSAMGTAVSAAVADAVASGDLTQERADALLARAQAGEYGALFGGRGGPGGPHAGPRVAGLRTAMGAAAAQALGITADELSAALRDGQTLGELAAAHGTTEEAVTGAALAAARAHLDQAVADGTLTQAQADAIYADLEAGGLRLEGRGGRRGDRVPPAEEAPAAAPDA